jgi:hypothetical protein
MKGCVAAMKQIKEEVLGERIRRESQKETIRRGDRARRCKRDIDGDESAENS